MAGGIGMKWLAASLALLLAAPAMASDMLVIAHRGASGERPEHTLVAYELAIDQGADFIEPDLVATSDGMLVARHENEISGTTDVADRPGFTDRRTTKTIDGEKTSGWFTEDFTLAELKTLRARERLPDLRPANTAHDGQYEVPTFAEVIALVQRKEDETGRRIGIYPELKHPGYFAAQGIDLAALLLSELAGAGYTSAGDPVFIQCFEVGTLARLEGQTGLRLVQLVASEGGPADLPEISYAAMLTPSGLAGIARYADALGADIRLILNADGSPTALVGDAAEAGLAVHGWTVRRENAFLPEALRNGSDPAAPGDMAALVRLLAEAGVAGIFTDNPGEVLAQR